MGNLWCTQIENINFTVMFKQELNEVSLNGATLCIYDWCPATPSIDNLGANTDINDGIV